MKKLFSNPEAEIIELSVKDILTASPDIIPGDGDDDDDIIDMDAEIGQ